MVVLFISLNELEALSTLVKEKGDNSPEIEDYLRDQTAPFANLTLRTTNTPISCLNLEIVNGTSVLAMIRGRSEIVVQYLESQRRAFLALAAPQEAHKVAL